VDHTFEMRLAVDDATGAHTARRAATTAIADWGVQAAVSEDACLVVNELVTNALVHGRSEAHLLLQHDEQCLRVEVADDNTRLPMVAPPDPQSLSGRGLLMIASLVKTWGVERTASGKCVWAELETGDRRSH